MAHLDAPDIRSWHTTSGREPVVRIGVVLDADDSKVVTIETPDEAYELRGRGCPTRGIRRTRIEARLSDNSVLVRVDNGTLERAPFWRIVPQAGQPIVPGAGALVRDVVAGRGFHWRKTLDQHLTGVLELRPGRHGVILINEIQLEPYLAGVITAEMGAECPAEFLKAQCVVARSWLLALTEKMHAGEPFDRCNDDCCQRYQGTDGLSAAAIAAATGTRGMAILDAQGAVVDANYSKCCGGVSELPDHVWGVHKPGLSAVVDAPAGGGEHRFLPVTGDLFHEYLNGSWLQSTKAYCSPNVVPPGDYARFLGRVDETKDYFRWTIQLPRADVDSALRAHVPEAIGFYRLHDLRVATRGLSGRALTLVVDYVDEGGAHHEVTLPSEYRIRQALHPGFLFSSAIAIEIQRDGAGVPTTITYRGAGWGHGAGLCQMGALGMGVCGIEHAAILKHYFPKTRLARVYP